MASTRNPFDPSDGATPVVIRKEDDEPVLSVQQYTSAEGGNMVCCGCGVSVHPRFIEAHEEFHVAMVWRGDRIRELRTELDALKAAHTKLAGSAVVRPPGPQP